MKMLMKIKKHLTIIGLAGTNASGKDTIARFFVKKGFDHFSLSDIIRSELKKRNLPENRDNLQKVGNSLREKFGPAILAKRSIKKIKKETIISSIRHPQEIEELKKNQSLILIWVDASVKLRYKRARGRGRLGKASFKDFVVEEQKEIQSVDPNNQQLWACRKLADFSIFNDSTLAQLNRKIENIFQKIRGKNAK